MISLIWQLCENTLNKKVDTKGTYKSKKDFSPPLPVSASQSVSRYTKPVACMFLIVSVDVTFTDLIQQVGASLGARLGAVSAEMRAVCSVISSVETVQLDERTTPAKKTHLSGKTNKQATTKNPQTQQTKTKQAYKRKTKRNKTTTNRKTKNDPPPPPSPSNQPTNQNNKQANKQTEHTKIILENNKNQSIKPTIKQK